jgi:MFS family permease
MLLCIEQFVVVTGPVAGYISDHTVTRFGKRMPYIVFGSMMYALFTLLRVFLESPGVKILVVNAMCLILGDMASQITMSCYLGLFPDLFYPDQIGLLSGMNAFVTLLATAIGVSVIGFVYGSYVPKVVVILAVGAFLIGIAVLLAVMYREPFWHYHRSIKWINPEDYNRLLKQQVNYSPSDIVEESSHDSSMLASIWKKFKRAFLDFFITLKKWNFMWLFITRCFFTLGLGKSLFLTRSINY